MSYLHYIGTAVPQNSYTQEEALAELVEVLELDAVALRKTKMLYRNSGISKRHTTLNNFFTYFKQKDTPTISQRMAWFCQDAPALAIQAIRDCVPQNFDYQTITHLLTVTCTGLSAPGLDIALVKALQLPSNIHRSSVNFMGCYAAFHALKQADYICRADSKAVVLVVCVELCSLHLQLKDDEDNTRANLLFSDGASAALVSADENMHHSKSLKIKHFYSDIIAKGETDMAWNITETGFQMKLSAYIPQLVEQHITELLQAALHTTQTKQEAIKYWAIHPGGRKIVDNVVKVLQLEAIQVAAAYKTLENYGNMSSATILFVLKEIATQTKETIKTTEKELIFALGFGPGLTIESLLLEKS
jgi:predicted naringenin-chalcone synthase